MAGGEDEELVADVGHCSVIAVVAVLVSQDGDRSRSKSKSKSRSWRRSSTSKSTSSSTSSSTGRA